jgi:hypothetical protein
MARFELPFNPPVIRSFLDHAYIFGMRNGLAPYDNFLYNIFGNLCLVQKEKSEGWFLNMFPAPWLKTLSQTNVFETIGFELWKDEASTREALESFVRSTIGSGYYCSFVLDDFFIEGRWAHKKCHFPHFCFVTGIDFRNSTIALVNYFSGVGDDFGIRWINIDTFVRAFNLCLKDQLIDPDSQEGYLTWWYKYVEGYRVNTRLRCEFNPREIAKQLANYLNSSYSEEDKKYHADDQPFRGQSIFGINVYEEFISLIETTFRRNGTIDLRFTRLFAEHKLFMLERLTAINSRIIHKIPEDNISQMRELTSIAQKVRFLAFDLSRTGNIESLSVMRKMLFECRELELKCLGAAHRYVAMV